VNPPARSIQCVLSKSSYWAELFTRGRAGCSTTRWDCRCVRDADAAMTGGRPCLSRSPFMSWVALPEEQTRSIQALADFHAAALSSSRRCHFGRSLWKVLTFCRTSPSAGPLARPFSLTWLTGRRRLSSAIDNQPEVSWRFLVFASGTGILNTQIVPELLSSWF